MKELEEIISEKDFGGSVDFTSNNPNFPPGVRNREKVIGVYIIRFNHKIKRKEGESDIFKIGEGQIQKRFRKYLWAPENQLKSTAIFVRFKMQELENNYPDSKFTVSWIECTKEEAKELEVELLCQYHVEHKEFPSGNKGCR